MTGTVFGMSPKGKAVAKQALFELARLFLVAELPCSAPIDSSRLTKYAQTVAPDCLDVAPESIVHAPAKIEEAKLRVSATMSSVVVTCKLCIATCMYS
jgi:hypothetical protein